MTLSKPRCLLFLVIGVLLMLSLVVDGQPTVDEDGSCQPTTLEEAVNSIRADIQLIPSCQSLDETTTARDVKLMKEDLTKVKNSTRDVGRIKEDVMELKNITKDMAMNKEDLAELKNLCASRQHSCSAIDSSSLCEYETYSLMQCDLLDIVLSLPVGHRPQITCAASIFLRL